MTLQPGQYQIGDVVFGKGTALPVSMVDIQAYNIQAQDSQLIRSDEIQFGFDSFQPAPIIFELGVLDFRALPNMSNLVGTASFTAGSNALSAFALAWRGDALRTSWGSVTPLKYCDRDGNVRVWYGRPRKFQASKRSNKGSFYVVHAEFQRADTLCYDETETIASIGGSGVTITRPADQADTWLRVVGSGPVTHPVITIGSNTVDLDLTIASGKQYEVSSYPWSRRAVTSDGVNISASLIGSTQYLDRLILPGGASTHVQGPSNTFIMWRNAYPVTL